MLVRLSSSSLSLLLLLVAQLTNAFIVPPKATSTAFVTHQQQQSSNSNGVALSMQMNDIITSAANNMWIATIDSDIAKMTDNEFAPVFAGGIAVMFGGVLSALFIGFILEKNDLYEQIVAETYVQGLGENEKEFWQKLAEDETDKARDLLEKLKRSKRDDLPGLEELTALMEEKDMELAAQKLEEIETIVEAATSSTAASSGESKEPVAETKTSLTAASNKKVDMFNDYSN